MAAIRCFIAADLEVGARLRGFATAVAETGAPVKMVDLNILHVTLKFLGDTEEGAVDAVDEVLQEACAGVEAIPITLRGAGAFPSLSHIKVVWVGMEGGAPLEGIATDLEAGLEPLGFKRERRPFRPHVTVGRVKGGRHKERLQQVLRDYQGAEFGAQTLDAVRLKQSVLTPKGPIYTTLREAHLG